MFVNEYSCKNSGSVRTNTANLVAVFEGITIEYNKVDIVYNDL